MLIKLSLIFFYILPNAFIGPMGRNIYYTNRGIYNIIFLILLLYLFGVNKLKLQTTDILLIIFVIFRIIFLKDFQSISLIGLILIKKIKFIKEAKIRNLLFLIFIISLLYSIYFFNFQGRLISTSIGEKNLSGFSIFILFLLSQKFKYLKVIFLFMGLLTFSRNFLLALLVFEIFNRSLILKKFISYFKLNKFFNLVLINFIAMSFLGIGFEKYIEFYGMNNYQKGIYRYTTLIDNSNLFRFQANNSVIKYFFYNRKKLLVGTTVKDFKNELKNNLNQYGIKREMEPHNFFYKYLLKYGIFSFYLFYYIGNIFKKISNKKIGIFYGFYIYSIFLGVGFYDFYLLILKYLMDTARERKKLEM